MKLEERERIEGTDITIGRRVYYKDGAAVVSPRWAAEYREGTGKQVCVNLGTGSKAAAHRKALALHAKLEDGQPHVADARLGLEEIVDAYFAFVKAKGVAKKTEWKYRADLDKVKTFCKEHQITLAMRFGREGFYRYREWLVKQGYQPKTVYAALTVCKQVFKWGHAEGRLKEYRLINTKLAEAKAKPQPCFTTEQVEQLINATSGVEQAVIATLGYAGLRIGEAEQMLWQDVRLGEKGAGMFHVRLGGSNGTTKDKDARFVPIHPRIRPLIAALPKQGDHVFPDVRERQLLQRVKELCGTLKFPKADGFKLHSFRHHFASLCANHQVAYRKALAWLGHSDSSILQLYYHLTDSDSQASMEALAGDGFRAPMELKPEVLPVEGNLRATGQSTIEKTLQVEAEQYITKLLGEGTERGRFELPLPFRADRFSKPAHSTTLPPLQSRATLFDAIGQIQRIGHVRSMFGAL
jgi:site-specific recombinase XerD